MPMKLPETPNRLINEKSPYLLQHAHNPVHWYPWGEEAFSKAREENKPVFLSIGYSTCHWCHVMERESFEDEEVAKVLNQSFIAIKVDREERPDIDHIYMTVCQALTGQGGWPLSVFLTPEKKPFYAGTYYPKKSRWGRPGFIDLLKQIATKWTTERDQLIQTGEQIKNMIQPQLTLVNPGEITQATLRQAFDDFRERFDNRYGGFGDAPKFPTPHNLTFLLRYYWATGENMALEMVEKTLQNMYRGGIYDHLGFGFSRYSTDQKWLVPHFEKMLYDNALLAIAYLEFAQVSGAREYAGVAEEIFTYVLRDMTSPEGGFYSAEDADSEGEEGKFYVWTPEEIKAVLGEQLGRIYCEAYDITERGNFEGKSIPNLINNNLEHLTHKAGLSIQELKQKLEEARQQLFKAREKRVHPYKDDKILTSWNGLMIAALAIGGRILQQPRYTQAAANALAFINKNLLRSDGRLMARFRDGEAAYPAYLDDYAFLIWGSLELYEATFEPLYLSHALELNRQMIDLFWDEAEGGLFFYGADSEQLIARPKEIYDGALPSGNSVAALNLLRLARLTGETRLEELAARQLATFGGRVERYPAGFTFLLMAAQFALNPGAEIVIMGDPALDETRKMLQVLQQEVFLPNSVYLLAPTGKAKNEIERLAPKVREMPPHDRPTAYICQNYSCQAPIFNPDSLRLNLQPVREI